LQVGITYNRMLCNDFTGPARFRLNMPEMTLELKRIWHPYFKTVATDNCKSRGFILCEKKHEWIWSSASTSLKNPLLVWDWMLVKKSAKTSNVL